MLVIPSFAQHMDFYNSSEGTKDWQIMDEYSAA